MWTPRQILVLVLGLTAPAVASAQGHAGHGGHPGASPATARPVVRPSEADIAFIQGMISHHAQAVEMVALVPQRTARRELRLIAERIDVSQRDEIVWMRDWLAEHGITETEGHGAHDHAAMGQARMPGMLSPEEMAALSQATGREFERRLSDVDADQRAEIVRMRKVLTTLSAPTAP